jgi:hypothetical protein
MPGRLRLEKQICKEQISKNLLQPVLVMLIALPVSAAAEPADKQPVLVAKLHWKTTEFLPGANPFASYCVEPR